MENITIQTKKRFDKDYKFKVVYNNYAISQNHEKDLNTDIYNKVYDLYDNSMYETLEEIKKLSVFERFNNYSNSLILRIDNINYIFKVVEFSKWEIWYLES